MKVCVALDENPFGIFTDKGSTVEQAVNEFYTFVSLEDTTLGMETAYAYPLSPYTAIPMCSA